MSRGKNFLFLVLAAAPSLGAAAGPFDQVVRPFLAKNCSTCHNAKTQSGGLNLELYESPNQVTKDRDLWQKLLDKLQTGQMPPKGMPRPAEADVKMVTQWIQAEFDRADRTAKPDPGHVTARRLNRTEYNNTVRDLLSVDLEPADDFPQDDAVYGFDNIAAALTVSPLLMEKYLAAAEKVVRAAVLGPDTKVATVKLTPPIPRRQEGANPTVITSPPPYSMTDYDVTGLAQQGSFHTTRRIPADGDYILRVFTTGSRPAGSETQTINLYVDGKILKTFDVLDVETQTKEKMPVGQEVRWKATAGEHHLALAFPRIFEGLPASFNGPNPSTKPALSGTTRGLPPLPANATPEQIAQRKAIEERIKARFSKFDSLAVSELDIVGPYQPRPGPSSESLRKVYVCGHLDGKHQPGCERKIIAGMAARAFRRPVTGEETADLIAVYSDARKRGRSFEQGISLALETILVSPEFLFRIEGTQTGSQPHLISEYELASRLSYFLWSSMPDDVLLRAARERTLRKPGVLEAQVRRMIKDARSRALAQNFAAQWLETRRLESVQPDRDRFPDFDDYLRDSMARETELFFQYIVQDDRNILDFIDAPYTFLNEELARYYKVSGVTGPEFRKVDLPGTGRGGLVTQASVLTVSSYGNRTSPVLRGKWILENLLNAAPPPPPANVPPLDEAAVGSTASLRVQLENHRKNAVCASCHSRMDPLGFALENYNAVGQWRTEDGKFPIDASGVLPDGRSFQGADGLKAILKSNPDTFAACLAEKLLVYALGRGVERYDRATIKKIVASVSDSHYRMSSLVLGIVNSVPFQMQRGEGVQP